MMPMQQALFSAPMAAVTAATTFRKPHARGASPQYGMTMWFEVTVDGGLSLGAWSACSGLGMKLNVEQVKEGINHDSPRIVPVGLTYGEIVLERAMTSADSKKLREWLEAVTTDWVNGPEGGAPAGPAGSARGLGGTPVTIKLYSALLPSKSGQTNEVAEWRLRDAYPVAWTGPLLSSKTSDVAIEKLTLAHSGFLKPGERTKSTSASAGQGMLRIVDDAMNSLPLQYNPEKVTMNKSVTIRDNSTGPTYVKDEQVTEPGKMSLSFEVRVEGVTAVAKTTAQLWAWLEPQQGWVSARPAGAPAKPATAAPTGKPANTSKPKVLTIHLGSGKNAIQRTAVLKQVNTTFTRFARTGDPSRATISITMEEKELKPKKTNPTSGGPPGGRVHTVTEGESLPAVATAAYGSPGAWREVAEHNGIDDPLRVRNGSPLYLPGA
jgi:phage tail-like protein